MTRSYLLIVLICVLALAFGQTASSQADSIAASDGSGASARTDYEPTTGGWEVGDPGGGNQDVYYDPDAGPWFKTLTLNPANPPQVGQIFTLIEKLHVGNGPDGLAPSWTDYHEEIQTPGWTWSPNGPQGEYPWGFSAPTWQGSAVYVIPAGNTMVDWTFNPPLPFCTDLTITKYLVFNGGDPTAPIVIAQYPTVPEPGTLALLAAASLGALVFVRRKRRTV